MVESADESSFPPTLQARPPTPPRESNHDHTKPGLFDRILKSSSTSSRRSSAPVSSTFTPDSSAESPKATGSLRKKVGFSDWPQYKEPPTVSFDGKGVLKHTVQPLPPSADRKPLKSILKAHNGDKERELAGTDAGDTILLPLHHYASFAKMLVSIVQQLSGKDRSSKVDAYLMLSGSLRASENVPDLKALKEQMGQLCHYIERDLAQKLDNGKPDSSLIVNALVVLGCFLHKSSTADCIPTDFTLRFVDHAIKVLEDGSMSKEVTKHMMFILAQQKFSSRVMTQDRVGRLLLALHTIEQNLQGKSIVQGRLQIYRTLLRQSRSHLSTHTIWMEDLLTDMLSSIREIRAQAIAFGLEAGISLGTEHAVSRTLQNLLKRETAEETKFGDYYIERLKAFPHKTDGPVVPQIWSVVILFLRSKPQLLEQWQFLPTFLSVLTPCLNISDKPTRTEAHYAFNRFIFAVNPTEKTSPKLRAILFQSLSSMLGRKSSTGRKRVMSSIYTLLYYTLSPMSTPVKLDMFWDEYLVPLIEVSLLPANHNTSNPDLAKIDAVEACLILRCLFDTKTPRKWSEHRAVENLAQNEMEAKELPAIDSKWLRKNHERVFRLLNPLLQKLYWDLEDESAITRLWQSYITSISSPAVMEVKVSFDTMACIASLFDTITQLWDNGPENLGILSNTVPASRQTAFWKGIEIILTTVIHGLGLLPFTDRALSIKHNNFVAIVTPSQQPSKYRSVTKSPLFHLVSMLTNTSPVLVFDTGFMQMASNVLAPFFNSKTSKRAQINFVKDMAVLLPTDPAPSLRCMWQVLAEFACGATDLREKTVVNALSDVPLGNDYRCVVNILETGLLLSPSRPLPRWRTLFEALLISAELDAGDSGKAIAVLEPLAKTIRSRVSALDPSCGLLYLTILLSKAIHPKDRQALEAAERKLWGAKQPGGKGASFDPYNEIYTCTRTCLESIYGSFAKSNINDYTDMILAINGLFQRCPNQLFHAVLAKLQSSIALWIADEGFKLGGGNSLGLTILNLWSSLCKLIPTLITSGTHTKILHDFETLICAGLESKHRAVVNVTIGMWNSTFGTCTDGLEYPAKAKQALLALCSVAELQLPNLPESLEIEAQSAGHRQPNFFNPQQDESSQYSGFSSLESAMNGIPNPQIGLKSMQKPHRPTPQGLVASRSGSLKRPRDETSGGSRRQSKKRDVTPRLRHNDSQAQFEAIPSSSPGFEKVADSQLLTERQKEVKERQNVDVVMFLDLRTIPRPRNRLPESEDVDQELPQHRSPSKIREMISRSMDRETTPVNVILSDDEINYVQSSPTPTRLTRSHVEDPPSSPPEASTRHMNPVLDDQISSSPPEGSPQPVSNAAARAAMLQEFHASRSRTQGDQVEAIPAHAIEINGQTDHPMTDPEPNFEATADIIMENETVNATGEDSKMDEEMTDVDEPEKSTTSIQEPSAQVDPCAMQLGIPVSTNDLPSYDRSSSPTDDPSDQLRASQLEADALQAARENDKFLSQISITKSMDSAPDSIADLDIAPVYEPRTPSTPRNVAVMNSSPKTPQFVDAPTSPFGSEKYDRFEDAVSSPRRDPGETPKMQETKSSSPLSEIDERSMLRIVAEYDQSSSRRVSFADDKENQLRQTRSSMSKVDQDHSPAKVSPSVPAKKSASRKRSNLRLSTQAAELEQSESEEVTTSSLPSLIPETPAPKATERVEQTDPVIKYYDDDGVEVDMNETIIVDTSVLDRDYGRLAHKRSSEKGNKRKHIEDATASNNVIASQDDGLEDGTPSQLSVATNALPSRVKSASPSKRSPAKKRGRGRPSKASKASSQKRQPQQIDEDQSFLSLDAGISFTGTDVSAGDETAMGGFDKLETPVTKSSCAVDMEDRSSPGGEIVMETILPDMSSLDAEIIGETTFGESSSAKESSAPHEREDQVEEVGKLEVDPTTDDRLPEEDNTTEEQAMPAKDTASGVATQNSLVNTASKQLHDEEVEMDDGGEVKGPSKPHDELANSIEAGKTEGLSAEKRVVSAQSMKDKLQSLMMDLRNAALSRQEVNELEDMFMDAKRVLYGAELRGRQSADV